MSKTKEAVSFGHTTPTLRKPLASLPSLCSGHITADKREIKDFLKSRQVGTSFIRKPLYAKSAKIFNRPSVGSLNRYE